jgi:hypothetical protein
MHAEDVMGQAFLSASGVRHVDVRSPLSLSNNPVNNPAFWALHVFRDERA